MLAAPRFADRKLLSETFRKIEEHAEAQQAERAMRLLEHVVPEFRWWVRDRGGEAAPSTPPALPSEGVVAIDKRLGERASPASEGRPTADPPPGGA